MLNTKLQAHVWSLVHSKSRSVERADSVVCAKPSKGNPCLDDYEFLRTLNEGSFATVYLVREKHTPHLYALKAIDKYTATGRRNVACSTVIDEQAALTELSGSDFILPLYASFHDTENYYFATEYLPGGDLQNLCSSKALDVEAVLFYMAELLVAIEHVHARNIIHRDIKPENVFIDTEGHIVLGDFGVARLFDDCAQKTHGRVGTPAFWSPEVNSGDYGFEADLWAFGVILYEMLSGGEDDTVDSSLMTEDAADLVSQLLRKSPDTRLSDITEIKKHPFFETIDWISVASRSLTPPWVPHLVSTRLVGVHYEEPIVCAGERYIDYGDPLPTFTFRAAPCSLSRACERRQQDFSVLEGSAPLVSWVEGSGHMEEMAPTRQKSLKSLSRWVMRTLNRPV